MKKAQMSSSTSIFVFIISFWILLAIFSNVLEVTIATTDVSDLRPDATDQDLEGSKNFLSGIFSTVQDIPIIGVFVPMLKMLTFQYVDVPPIVTLVLDLIAILSGFVIFSMIRGNG